MNTEWISHNSKGETVAKCAKCGWNAAARHIGTDRECPNCEDIADDARLAADKLARWEAMSAALPVVNVDAAPSALAALADACFGE
jgi:hypothetical protein